MNSCDVLIVGGGPAGSSCAWGLRNSGLDVVILDKQLFPRDKVCGGWINPRVLTKLGIDPLEYSRERVLQPITGFRTSCIGGPVVETQYDRPISYGIRRIEFDDYLLKRSGARILDPAALTHLKRKDEKWIVNSELQTRMLVGAGGTFCPVARFLGARVGAEPVVAAQEAEVELNGSDCAVQGEYPEIYFCSDMKGYGWCFRKGNVLNVGLGRLDSHGLSAHSTEFLRFLTLAGRVPRHFTPRLSGHAYLLKGFATREVVGDGIVLVGDATGMAYPVSGEGIRPAIESGLLAGRAIATADGCYTRDRLEAYRVQLIERFAGSNADWLTRMARALPVAFVDSIAQRLLATRWFTRHVVLDRWFLNLDLAGVRGI